MLEVDAYDHAQSVFGPTAGVWRVAPERCLVGRWIPLGDIDGDAVILRTQRHGFIVLGEGATFPLAFANADLRSQVGDQFGPVLDTPQAAQ